MDINEISALLHIHEKASAHGDALKNIKDAAWKTLLSANEEHAPQVKETGAIISEEEPVEEEPVAEGE